MVLLSELSSETISWIEEVDEISLDTETVSLKDLSILGFSFAAKKDNKLIAFYVPLKHSKMTNMSFGDAGVLLSLILSRKNVIFHNYSFDSRVLFKVGLGVKYLPHDTLILSQLWDENIPHGLKSLVDRYFGYRMTKYEEICGKGKSKINLSDAEPNVVDEYASDDALWTFILFSYLYSRIEKDEGLLRIYEKIERPLTRVIYDMQTKGFLVDVNRVEEIAVLCRAEMEKYKKAIHEIMGREVNLNSTKQLKEYFIDECHMDILKTSKITKEPSMDKEVLEQYAEKVKEADLILKYRHFQKVLSTFVPALTPQESDKICALFNQSGTVSGRFSSSSPNMQNIPREDEMKIRHIILPDLGEF